MSSQTQTEISNGPTDAISAVRFSAQAPHLLVSSWDKNVYLFETGQPGGRLLIKIPHVAPVLDVCFGSGETAFSAGLNWNVMRLDLNTGAQSILSTHQGGVKAVLYSQQHDLLLSAAWDKTLHVHHLSRPDTPPTVIALPEKPFSLSASPSRLVVAMANRALQIYDWSSLVEADTSVEPWQRRESSLKFMTRAVACMPSDLGYASSSIEGRVAVEWFDASAESQARKYAFKCHRQASDEGVDVVYPVNALAFHPVFGTFASGGGDGVVALWDATAKRRIRQYQKYGSSIAALDFSPDGRFLAIAVSPGFEDGDDVVTAGDVKIFVRELNATEAKGKGK